MSKEIALRHGLSIQDGKLYMDDLSLEEIAQKVQTPVYVYSQTKLEQTMQDYVNAFVSDTFHTRVVYASKAFNVLAVLKLASRFGMGVDVVSGGELYTAFKAGFDMSKVVFHGNNKSSQELEMALEYGVGTIVLDHLHEALTLKEIAGKYPQAKTSALLRVNPGVEAHTHDFIVTARPDSKFGILASHMDDIIEIASVFDDCKAVSFDGFHAHIGSQIFDGNAFLSEIEEMAKVMAEFEAKSGKRLKTLDLGGGFAAWYTTKDEPIEIDEVCRLIVEGCKEAFARWNLAIENVWIEPGRSIVCNAGITLYTVGAVKQTPGKTYAFVDGGMNDNIRPALYQAEYDADLANRMDEAADHTYTVAGKCCESGDILIQKASLPEVKPEDLLVIYSTGAYGYSMASHYNKNPIPGVLFVKGDQAKWAVRPESYEDLMAREEDIEL